MAVAAQAADAPAAWLGIWVIDRDMGAAPVSALDASQVKALIGTRLRLGGDATAPGGAPCRSPDYQETHESTAAFAAAFRVDPAAMGIAGDPIDQLHVACADAAFDLVALGSGQAILITDGHVFHATQQGGL